MIEQPANDPFAQHIITRKRKKYKFANFDSFPNCFSHLRTTNAKHTLEKLKTYLADKPMVLEIAAGNAQFSFELAKKHPDLNFIAVDIKSDRLYTSAKKALAEGVKNIAFLRTHMNELGDIFPKKSVETIWLTFPDPFPKKRSAKHRLSHVSFLRQYRSILKDAGLLKFKTDNRELFLWSLEQFVAQSWHICELSFDLHESNLPDDYKIKTYYETRFTQEGIPINYCTLNV
ncbi:MAG TPA: tRNA (guanosine(46)-N7)-methyltransferase TrmB [Candidatus Saccharibacteria bacterium]|jgi:tRNA (guanine-N7-)-methyltransferase|nr:tRNA (guanine-N7-)-methyltransferase [Patescibacteria group bacterium]HMS30919.1 tRNA (guanosine(46)-N7)-methyltransferase TrmB [Candidatus Saccharibacteria bacterium]